MQQGSSVRVVLRLRPFLEGEERGDRCAYISKDDSTAVDLDRGADSLRYKYNMM